MTMTRKNGMHAITRRAGTLLIPMTAGIFIPGLLYLLLEPARPLLPGGRWTLVGYPLIASGIYLTSHAAALVYFLQDTPLGDKPPPQLVTSAVYSYVRNPMALGMFLTLMGEATVLRSVVILGWAGIFMGISHWLALRVEEPSLRAAFGPVYEQYVATTPHWVPRFRFLVQSTPHYHE